MSSVKCLGSKEDLQRRALPSWLMAFRALGGCFFTQWSTQSLKVVLQNVCGISRRRHATQWELSAWLSTSRGIGVAFTLPSHCRQPEYSLANGSYEVHWLALQSFLYRSMSQAGHCMSAELSNSLAWLEQGDEQLWHPKWLQAGESPG